MPKKYPVYQCRTCDHVWEPGRPEVKLCQLCRGPDIFRPSPEVPPRQGRKAVVTVRHSASSPVVVTVGSAAEPAPVARPRSGIGGAAKAALFAGVLLGGMVIAARVLGWPPFEDAGPPGGDRAGGPGPSPPSVVRSLPGTAGVLPATAASPSALSEPLVVDATVPDLIAAWRQGPEGLRARFGHRWVRLATRVYMPPGQSTMLLNQSPAIVCHLPQGMVVPTGVDPTMTVTVRGRVHGVEGGALALWDCRFERAP